MKKNRHDKILEIIQKFDVETQEELAERLKNEGYLVTQATISRDIRELGLSKIAAADGGQKYAALEKNDSCLEDKYVRVLKDAYAASETAQNILVVKTVSGMAMAAAAALDAMKFSEIVGCIAGDDTVFVAVHTAEEAEILSDKIKRIMS